MTPAAVCPQHPESPSIATCVRCGRFLCAPCRVTADPPLCATCRPLHLDPHGILAEPFSLAGTLRNGWRMFTAVLPAVAGISFAFSVPAGLISYAATHRDDSLRQTLNNVRMVNFYDALIGLIGTIACLALFIGVAEGRTLSLSQAVKEGTGAWGRVFGARFRTGLFILLWGLLLILPGIWKAVLYTFATVAALRVPGEDALAFSTDLVQTRERWWTVLGMVILISLIADVPAVIVAGIIGAASEVIYEAAPRSAIVFEIATDWVARMGEMLATAFTLSMFYGFMRTDERSLSPMIWSSHSPE